MQLCTLLKWCLCVQKNWGINNINMIKWGIHYSLYAERKVLSRTTISHMRASFYSSQQSFTSFCRFQKLLIVLLANINFPFQLCCIGACKDFGLLAIFHKIIKAGLQIAQNLLMFTWQHRLYLQQIINPRHSQQWCITHTAPCSAFYQKAILADYWDGKVKESRIWKPAVPKLESTWQVIVSTHYKILFHL